MSIQVLDKTFVPYLSEQEIQNRINQLAIQISADYEGKNPLFIGILNGSFMFASDLFKNITTPSTISFIKLASYKGTTSTGTVITSIGLEENLQDKDIIIIEDIVDTGSTMLEILQKVDDRRPAEIRIVTLVHRKGSKHHVDFNAFEIEDQWVVGYGLDDNGLKRNYRNIYKK